MIAAAVYACVLASVVPAASRDWTPEVFDYDRPEHLEITERGVPKDKLPDTRQQELIFKNLRGEDVPVLVTMPPTGKGPFPAVLLVHPLGGSRQQITREVAGAMTAKGFACVALDLPKHGERGGKASELFIAGDVEKTYKNVIATIKDIRQTIDLIKERKDLNAEKGVSAVGYSLGAWFATLAGAADRRVSCLVLQGGGIGLIAEQTKDRGKLFNFDRGILDHHPTVRPQTAIAEFAPRPILMQNGKKDPFISQDNARNLYRHAKAPKEIKFYECGHILPEKAEQEAAEWVKKMREGG
jgi:hypothetical protein